MIKQQKISSSINPNNKAEGIISLSIIPVFAIDLFVCQKHSYLALNKLEFIFDKT